jgi:hypothetical protein
MRVKLGYNDNSYNEFTIVTNTGRVKFIKDKFDCVQQESLWQKNWPLLKGGNCSEVKYVINVLNELKKWWSLWTGGSLFGSGRNSCLTVHKFQIISQVTLSHLTALFTLVTTTRSPSKRITKYFVKINHAHWDTW